MNCLSRCMNVQVARPLAMIVVGLMVCVMFVQAQEVVVPWSGDTGIRKTTTEIMALPPLKRAPGFEKIRLERELEQPDRENLPQAPGAIPEGQWPPLDPFQRSQNPSSPALSPQSLGISFTGATLADAGAFPPDCMGAAGSNQFLVFINGRIRTFSKSTGVADGVINVDPDVFFSSVMTPVSPPVVLNFTSDPQVRYDRLTNRWFVTIIDVPCINATCTSTAPNRALIAVTDAASGGTISGSTVWTFYYFQGDATNFVDYPSLGIDVNALYIGGDMFSSTGTFVGTNGFVIRKSSVLSGGPIVVTTFANLAAGTGAGPFAPRGVDNFDPTATEGYFIGVDNATFGTLMLRRIGTPGGTPSISSNISITVSTTTFPSPVTHLGNTGGNNGRLDALDDRLFAAHIRNGRLWTAHNIRVSATGVGSTAAQSRDASRWYELNVPVGSGTPTVVQSGTIFDNAATLAAARQYWIPSVMVSGQGHAALGFSTAGTPFRADAATVGRLAGDALGTMGSVSIYTTTGSAYNPPSDPGGASGRRWGDYSFTSVDPLDDMTMWTIQEFCDNTNSWGVRAVKLIAPPPATPSTAAPNSITQGQSGVNVVITGTSVSGSGFFDPGTGFPNHITASVSGSGVTVNSVTYTNPTHITVNLSVSISAPIGDRNITITNPDGQSITSNPIPAIITVDAALPIQMTSFVGSFVGHETVRLDWATISEIMNYGFDVQRSQERSTNYQTIPGSFIPGHGTTNEPQYYNYIDTAALGSSLYYRLKQIDLDGTSNYSDPIRVSIATSVSIEDVPSEFSLAQNYPNPFNPATVLGYGLPAASFVKLEVFNALGQRVALMVNGREEAGFHEVIFETTAFPSGVYFCIMQAGEFRASRKLLLLK